MANEKRLIDAYKLEDLLRSNCSRYHHKDDVIAAITGQPTVDAVETQYGKWIFDAEYSFEYVCTNCRGHVGNTTNYRFCPHCGSYMREKPRQDVPF